MGRKCKHTPFSLIHNAAILFNPVKIAESFKFFFANIGPNIAKRISKRKKSPIAYLNDKILNHFCFYPITPNEIIKIIKSFLTTNYPVLIASTNIYTEELR